MEIVIEKASEPQFWYASNIGEKFKVYSELDDDYCVEDYNSMLVLKSDCKVIQG